MTRVVYTSLRYFKNNTESAERPLLLRVLTRMNGSFPYSATVGTV